MADEKRGGSFNITQELFCDILTEKMGIKVKQAMISNDHVHDGFKISILTDDDRFPILRVGHELPMFTPIVKKHEDGRLELQAIKFW